MNASVSMPRFAVRHLHDEMRCKHCQQKITEQDVIFAGAGRTNDGIICFTYHHKCPACGKIVAALDRLRVFSRPDWWIEIAHWHDENLDDIKMPRIGTMILDMIELDSIAIRGGYKGDVGPVMLIYSNAKGKLIEGFVKLERDSTISLYEHEAPLGLTRNGLREFNLMDEGDMFEIHGRVWTKMSASEIEEIITDRVFRVSTDPDEKATTPEPSPRRGHGSTHARKGRKGTRRPPRDPRPLDS